MAIKIPKPELKGFVIYNPENGLFSGGTSSPSWKNKPKIWTNIGHVKNHIIGVLNLGAERDSYSTSSLMVNDKKIYRVSRRYEGCEVYDIINDSKIDFDIYDYFREYFKKNYYGRDGYTLVYV